MRAIRGRKWFLVMLVVAGLFGCRPEGQLEEAMAGEARPGPTDELELRSYAVEPGYTGHLVGLLDSVLGGDELQAGRVTVAPGDRLLVLAPAPIQEGVERLLSDLEGALEPPPPPVAIEVTYWLVLGRPGESDDAVAPGELASTLVAITEAQGPHRFAVLERLSSISLEGQHADVEGSYAEIAQRVGLDGDQVMAELNIHGAGRSVSTRVRLDSRGQTLVLGQVGFNERMDCHPFDSRAVIVPVEASEGTGHAAPLAPDGQPDDALFFVIRVRELG